MGMAQIFDVTPMGAKQTKGRTTRVRPFARILNRIAIYYIAKFCFVLAAFATALRLSSDVGIMPRSAR